MAKQQTARTSGGQTSAGGPAGGPAGPMESRANPRENTARVAMRGSELPGWFWGLLGCLSVLGVGSAVLFFVFKPAGGLAGPANLAAPAAPADRSTSSAQIDIEPMAPPPAPGGPAPKPTPPPPPLSGA